MPGFLIDQVFPSTPPIIDMFGFTSLSRLTGKSCENPRDGPSLPVLYGTYY